MSTLYMDFMCKDQEVKHLDLCRLCLLTA